MLSNGNTIWDLLTVHLIEGGRDPEDATVVTILLQVIVLRGALPTELPVHLSLEHTCEV
jgi:hypothetical protein